MEGGNAASLPQTCSLKRNKAWAGQTKPFGNPVLSTAAALSLEAHLLVVRDASLIWCVSVLGLV